MRLFALALTFVLFAPVCVVLLAPACSAVVYHDYYGAYGGDEWVDWDQAYLNDYLLYNKSHATPPFAPQNTFGGCYIANGSKLLDDLDCDKVPDRYDNCLGIPNPDQLDQNRNYLGDACDLVVESVTLDPPVVLEGRAFVGTTSIVNYRNFDLRNLELTLQVPALGLEQKVYVDALAAGARGNYEFFLRLPDCVKPKKYDVVLFVEFPKLPGVMESFSIPLRMEAKSSGLCTPNGTPGAREGASIITILELQDIDVKSGGAYPFTIVNSEPESQAYVFTFDGLDEWGEAIVEPRSLIVVPAGENRKGQLNIYAKEGATGEHTFSLMIRSRKDAQQVMMKANIKSQESVLPGKSDNTLLFGILVVGLIIILLAVAAMRKRAEKK